MAETPSPSSQRPLVVTIGAVLVTIIVITGIVLWPTTSDCVNGGGSFGSCVQQSLADRGLAPAPAPTESVTAEPEITAGPEVVPEPEIVAAAPTIDARVEADGSTILAGTVDPNIDVHLFFNGIEIGQTKSDSVGDWIFIPNDPLPTGGVAITLRTGSDGGMFVEGPEALAVVVDGANQPVVVASAPDDVANVIAEMTDTTPEAIAGEAPPIEVAAVEPDQVPEMNTPETAVPDADLVTPTPAPADQPVVVETPEIVAPPEAAEPAVVAEPEVAESPAEAIPQQPAIAETPAEIAPETVQDEPPQIAAVEPEQVVPEAPVTAVPPAISGAPTIDAVEVEPDGSYIAGGGEDGSTIRLFVDGLFVGESLVEGGRWLVETDEALTEPSQRIRAEMVAPDEMVIAEAEINFVIERPENTGPAGDADLILPSDQLAPIALPTQAPMVIADAPVEHAAPVEPGLILPADALSAMSLPTAPPAFEIAEVASEAPIAEEAPLVVAETEVSIPNDQLPPVELPTHAPLIAVPAAQLSDEATPEAEPEVVVAEAEPIVEPSPDTAAALVLPEDQLTPIELPTMAPLVISTEIAPAPVAVADVEAEPLIPPDDQLAPLELPTMAPLVIAPETAPVADAETERLVLPEDQLAPLELPTMAPLVIATETAPAPIAVAEAEAAPLVLSDDQLAPLVLPSEAPLVAIENAAEPASSDGAEPVAPTPAPAIVRLPADQLPAIEMPTEAPPVVEAQSELPVLIATPIGDPEDGRFASGKVIIRRGDNLWTIARRVYGRGIEYTVIFDANREKIANPHWIFPGQVFDLPENEQR